MNNKLILAAAAAFAIQASAPALAADADYFKNKTLKIVIPYGPGGTYDKYGQTFAEFIGRHVPGNPTVIVQHMPGAGGMKRPGYELHLLQAGGRHARRQDQGRQRLQGIVEGDVRHRTGRIPDGGV